MTTGEELLCFYEVLFCLFIGFCIVALFMKLRYGDSIYEQDDEYEVTVNPRGNMGKEQGRKR